MGTNDSPQLRACFDDFARGLTDDEVASILNNDASAELKDLITVGFDRCYNSSPTLAAETTDDPDLNLLVDDPVTWLQTRMTTVAQALCENRPEMLDAVYASASTDLPKLRSQAGQACPDPIVQAVTTSRGDGSSLADYWLVDGEELQFYAVDSGWAENNRSWSVHVVLEDGKWKILSNS